MSCSLQREKLSSTLFPVCLRTSPGQPSTCLISLCVPFPTIQRHPTCLPCSLTDPTTLQCSYLMFHWVTGIPFGSELHGGAYDDLTLWEQIDGGAQNTPSKKWLFSVPVGLCVLPTSLPSQTHSHDHKPKTAFCSRHTTRITTHGCSRSISQP